MQVINMIYLANSYKRTIGRCRSERSIYMTKEEILHKKSDIYPVRYLQQK